MKAYGADGHLATVNVHAMVANNDVAISFDQAGNNPPLLISALDLPCNWLAALVVRQFDLSYTCCKMQEYQVRILDADKYEATQRLQQNCVTLTSKVDQLNGLVKTYLEVLDKQVILPCIRCSTITVDSLITSTYCKF